MFLAFMLSLPLISNPEYLRVFFMIFDIQKAFDKLFFAFTLWKNGSLIPGADIG